MKAALGDTRVSDAFCDTAPLSVEPGRDKGIYKTDEEHIYAIAEAMRVEYEAIAELVSRCRSTTPGSAHCGTASASRWGSTDIASTARCGAKR